MTLIQKFANRDQFAWYAEYVSSYDFDNEALKTWYDNNPNFVLSYTGIMKAIKPFVTGTLVAAGKTAGQADS
jgi:hypothetical protein